MKRRRFLSAAVITLAASSSFGYSLVDRQYNFSYYFEAVSLSGAAYVQGQTAGVGANSSFEQFWDDSGTLNAHYVADFDLSVAVKYGIGEAAPQYIWVTHSRQTSNIARVGSGLGWAEPMGGSPGNWVSDASGGTAKATLKVLLGQINLNHSSETIGTSDESGMNGRGDSQQTTVNSNFTVTAELAKDGGTTSVYENGKWYFKQKYKHKAKTILGSYKADGQTTLFLPWCTFDISANSSFQVVPGILSLWTESAIN